MRSLVAVCDAHLVTMEEQRRHELAALRRRARYERYRNKCNSKIQTCDRDLAVNVSYDGSRLEVRVQNPLTVLPTDGSRYTTYEVAINTNNIAFTLPRSYVRRRYSDFTWLRKQLSSDHNDVAPPELPPKTWWGGQFEPAVIEQRIHGLKTFMEGVLLHRVYLSNKALHLFVQSELDTRQIEHVLSGRDPTPVNDHILEASRICSSRARCYNCREDEECVDDTESWCSDSSDVKRSEDDFLPGALYSDLRAGTADLRDLEKSGSDLERSSDAQKAVPLMCSTPQRCWSDSALVLNDSQEGNSSSDGDGDSTGSSSSREDTSSDSPDCAVACSSSVARLRKIKPVLSQSLPTVHGMHMRCGHRKRRVTFSLEVTVAKVLEKPEDLEDGKKVALVQVHEHKSKTKGQ